MLHPCFALKPEGHWADYEAGGWARLARDTFLRDIGGRELHVEGIRSMADVIYAGALRDSGKSRFLDKTPRYYTIIDELAEVFPDSPRVILLRNPLAVMCSVIRTWVQDKWYRLPRYRDDLMKAPGLLSAAMERSGERTIVVRYEDLVRDPVGELKRLCDRLGLQYESGILDYRSSGDDFAFGDASGVKQHEQPVPDHLERWHDDIRDAKIWRLVSDYLDTLVKETPGVLGYDAEALRQVLNENRPGRLATASARSLKDVMQSDDLVPGLI